MSLLTSTTCLSGKSSGSARTTARIMLSALSCIQLTDVKNVLTIPLSALGDPVGDNRYKVKLLRNGETREREVTIGARNDTDVEIVKGLEAGDEVVIGEAKPGAAQ